MTAELATLSNLIVSLAYFAITFAILAPLVRSRQVRSNRLGTATAAIFFSCAVGHGFHAVHAVGALRSGTTAMTGMGISWFEAVVELGTAAIAVYYWSLRRTYGALMQGATLFADLEQQQRMVELEHREALTAAAGAAQRERDAQAAMLQAIIANSQSLIYVKDLDGRYLMANEPFERAFSVRATTLVGQTDEFLDPQRAPVWRTNDLRAQAESFAVEESSQGPDGPYYFESVKFPLRDAAGRVYATCGVSLDVTARRRASDEMARARDVALAATAAKSAFLATMSHEIRTPMNAVVGLTGLLLDTSLDDHQRDLMETVRSSGDALLVVINDILDFSKIEAHELHLEEHSFNLRTCVDGALDLVAHSAAAKGLDLVLDLAPESPQRVVGDASRLRQVLVNLLNNAVKFTDTGDVALTVTADPRPPGRTDLHFAVRDTGIGIPADRMNRLFRSFSQVDASTTRVYGGTGLGLAISQGLVRAMGGELRAQSEAGVGSTFDFAVELGVSDSPEPAVALAGRAVAPVPAAAAAPARLRVLLAEDNVVNQKVAKLMLAALGYQVDAVADGQEAVAALAQAEYDVVLMDIHMPRMDGLEATRILRDRLPAARQPQIVALTASALVDDRRACAEAGMDDFLLKPFRQEQLAAVLTRLARSGPSPVEAASPVS